MFISILISIATCFSLMLVILLKPSIKIGGKDFDIYWIIPILGALLLIVIGKVGLSEIANGFLSNTATNPLKVIILFFSMSIISVYLDETGFFEYVATLTVNKAHSSQKRLFIMLYVIVSLLTVFTSNDIIILTFTPFICKFCKHAKIEATPYIVSEFVAANTWSMLLIIGNPTNIYITTASGIDFLNYLTVMAIPTLFAGVSGFVALYIIFRKKLSVPINCDCEIHKIEHKSLAIIGLVHLALCTVTLAVSGYVQIEMWVVSLAFAISLFLFVAVYRTLRKQKPTILIKTVKRLPYQLAPTVIGMFIVVLALVGSGVTKYLAEFFGNTLTGVKYGVMSTLFCNFMNNIPMSVFFTSIISNVDASAVNFAVYGTVIGSNLGALLTPMGALAGIMFTSLLKNHGQSFGFTDFIKYGSIVTAVSLLFAIGGLYLSDYIVG